MSFQSQAVGRFVLSTFSHRTECGQFAASLSIRSGSGSGTHDRVFRFIPLFRSKRAAERYALAQGREYLALPALPA